MVPEFCCCVFRVLPTTFLLKRELGVTILTSYIAFLYVCLTCWYIFEELRIYVTKSLKTSVPDSQKYNMELELA